MTADHTATQHRQSRLPEVPEPGVPSGPYADQPGLPPRLGGQVAVAHGIHPEGDEEGAHPGEDSAARVAGLGQRAVVATMDGRSPGYTSSSGIRRP